MVEGVLPLLKSVKCIYLCMCSTVYEEGVCTNEDIRARTAIFFLMFSLARQVCCKME